MKINGRILAVLNSCVSGGITIALLVWVILLSLECPASNGFMLLTIPMFVFWVIWTIGQIVQCSDKKYTNETELEILKTKKKRMEPYIFYLVTAITLAASCWCVVVLRDLMRYHEGSVAEKDMQILTGMHAAAINTVMQVELDETEDYVITFSDTDFEIRGMRDGERAEGIREFREIFTDYMDDYTPLCLNSLRKQMKSGKFKKLSSITITIAMPKDRVSLDCVVRDGEKIEITSQEEGKYFAEERWYVYEGNDVMGEAFKNGKYPINCCIHFYPDGTEYWVDSQISSYIGMGSYRIIGDEVIIADNPMGMMDGTMTQRINHFRIKGDQLIFSEKGSDNFNWVKLTDGEKLNWDKNMPTD